MGHHGFLRLAVVAVAVGGTTAVFFGCAPSPQDVPCRNDGECAAKSDRFAFCLQSRCVECVGRGSCGGSPCNDGVCEIPCDTAKDCRHDDDVCDGGMCRPR